MDEAAFLKAVLSWKAGWRSEPNPGPFNLSDQRADQIHAYVVAVLDAATS